MTRLFCFAPVFMQLSVKSVIVEFDCHVHLLQPSLLAESHRDLHAFLGSLVQVLSRNSAEQTSQLPGQILTGRGSAMGS